MQQDQANQPPPAVIVEVQFTAPGGEHLARHVRQLMESACVGVLADLSDRERRGVRVTSWLTEEDER